MAEASSKRVLITCTGAPYANSRLRDAMDAALAFGTFDIAVSLLLLDDAVTLVLPGQPEAERKNLSKLALALNEFGVEHIYVEEDAITRRGITPERELFEILTSDQMAAVIREYDVVLDC